MMQIRDQWPMEDRIEASHAITQKCLKLAISQKAIISAYWPMNSEVDCRDICHGMLRRGHTVSLPVVEKKDAPLIFRAWHPQNLMKVTALNIKVPMEDAPLVEPDCLFVPMLGFDRKLFRLGYGGGFYDRTLSALRARKNIKAIGIAFSIQELENIPTELFDAQLDMIITEKEEIKLG